MMRVFVLQAAAAVCLLGLTGPALAAEGAPVPTPAPQLAAADDEDVTPDADAPPEEPEAEAAADDAPQEPDAEPEAAAEAPADQAQPDAEAAAEDAPQDAAKDAAKAEQDEKARKKKAEVRELCGLLTEAADAHGVPQDFFIRLIWKESRFNAGAVSPVGAQGIAQFMPGTARIRGLKNPFDRREALFASAHFLSDLYDRFGEWGLAAAGYNGGPNRVPPFVAGRAGLPYETIDYVYSITGRTAKHWAHRVRKRQKSVDDAGIEAEAAQEERPDWRERGDLALLTPQEEAAVPRTPATGLAGGVLEAALTEEPTLAYPPPARPHYRIEEVDCPQLIARLGRARSVAPPTGGGFTRWGAQVAGHPKRAIAMRQYARLKSRLPSDLVARGPTVIVRRFAARGRQPIHAVQFSAPSRQAAQALCQRIARSLAPCVVVKNG